MAGNTSRERWVIFILLTAIFLFVVADLLSDSPQQLRGLHLILEVGLGLVSLLGIVFYYVVSSKARSELIGSKTDLTNKSHLLETVEAKLRETEFALEETKAQQKKFQEESQAWKTETDKHIRGLSESIDRQLERWGLTAAEKEVALLLLKGLGLKEIAFIRKVTEKTVRAQATVIYSKSGLNGRSELAAFFLEDLLAPKSLT